MFYFSFYYYLIVVLYFYIFFFVPLERTTTTTTKHNISEDRDRDAEMTINSCFSRANPLCPSIRVRDTVGNRRRVQSHHT
eukprot:gene266-140_t